MKFSDTYHQKTFFNPDRGDKIKPVSGFFYGLKRNAIYPGALVVPQKIGIDSNQHEQTPNAKGEILVCDVPLKSKSFLRDEVRDVAGDGERCGILGLTTKKKSPTLVNRA